MLNVLHQGNINLILAETSVSALVHVTASLAWLVVIYSTGCMLQLHVTCVATIWYAQHDGEVKRCSYKVHDDMILRVHASVGAQVQVLPFA